LIERMCLYKKECLDDLTSAYLTQNALHHQIVFITNC